MVLEIKRSNRVVVGLFTHRMDAYRALEELREAGFPPQEIGAAFRSMTQESWFPSEINEEETQDVIQQHQTAYSGPGVTGVGSGAAGAASGTNTVTPAGLSTGGGTTTTGPGRPGPIPGTEIPHHRRTSQGNSFNMAGAGLAASEQAGTASSTPQTAEQREWWQRVRNIFVSDKEQTRRGEGISKDDIDYGTGAGHLPLQAPVSPAGSAASGWSKHAYNYEAGSLRDLLTDLGMEAEAARYFSTLLPPGGAVVTVRTASRASDAELILEGNKGRVRFEGSPAAGVDLGEQYDDDRMAVFGEVQHACQQRGMNTSAENLEGFPGQVGKVRRPA